MNTSTTDMELRSLLEKLAAENFAGENDKKAHQKRIKEIDKKIEDNNDLIRAVRIRLGMANSNVGYGNKAEMLRTAITQIPKQHLTQNDVLDEIKHSSPGWDVDNRWLRTALWTLAEKGQLIRTVRPGNNRQPAEYEKLTSSNGTTQNGASHPRESNRRAVGIADNKGAITVGQLEDLVRKKNRRMKDITGHFNVDEATVSKLLEPASKVYRADKGWIKIR